MQPCFRVGHLPAAGLGLWPLHDVVIHNIVWCIKHKRGLGGRRILPSSRAIVLQHCGQCRQAGQWKDDWLVHKRLEVKQSLVKANSGSHVWIWPTGALAACADDLRGEGARPQGHRLARGLQAARRVPLRECYEQALVCLSNREIVNASRGRTFHCKMANNLCSLIVLA